MHPHLFSSIAVCGIAKLCPDDKGEDDDDDGDGHAVVVAKLARDWVEKFNEIRAAASPADDVSCLWLRVGVCSGPVT